MPKEVPVRLVPTKTRWRSTEPPLSSAVWKGITIAVPFCGVGAGVSCCGFLLGRKRSGGKVQRIRGYGVEGKVSRTRPFERWNRIVTHPRDLGCMVYKVHRRISVVAESHFLMHKNLVGEGVEHFGLLVLRRVGLGGVCGAAEGVVFVRAPFARLEWCGEGGDGEGEEGKDECEMHCGWVGWSLG